MKTLLKERTVRRVGERERARWLDGLETLPPWREPALDLSKLRLNAERRVQVVTTPAVDEAPSVIVVAFQAVLVLLAVVTALSMVVLGPFGFFPAIALGLTYPVYELICG